MEERKKILEMLSEGKINVNEAERLMSTLSDTGADPKDSTVKNPKYLRVLVEPGPGSKSSDEVNIRIPLKLIRAGLKLTSFIPKNAQHDINNALHEKGIDMDLNKIKAEDIDEIIREIDNLTVDVKGKEKIRVYCE